MPCLCNRTPSSTPIIPPRTIQGSLTPEYVDAPPASPGGLGQHHEQLFLCFSFFPRVRRSGRSEECSCQHKKPEPDPQMCPDAYSDINSTWNSVTTHCCGYKCHSCIARCCTQTNHFDCSRLQFPKAIQDKKTSSMVCVCQRVWGQSSAQAGRGTGSILQGTTGAVGGCFISLQCLILLFFPRERRKLFFDEDFALGNSGF